MLVLFLPSSCSINVHTLCSPSYIDLASAKILVPVFRIEKKKLYKLTKRPLTFVYTDIINKMCKSRLETPQVLTSSSVDNCNSQS